MDVQSAEIFFEVFHAFGARDGHNIFALREHPGEGELRSGASFLTSHLFDARNELDVALKILALESRRVSPDVVGRKIFVAFDLAGEKTASERTIGNKA